MVGFEVLNKVNWEKKSIKFILHIYMTLNPFQAGVFLYLFPLWVILKPRKLKHIFSSLHHVTIKETKMKVHGSFFRRIRNYFFLKKWFKLGSQMWADATRWAAARLKWVWSPTCTGLGPFLLPRLTLEPNVQERLRHMRNGLLLSHFKINPTKWFQQSHTQRAQTQK